MKSALAILGSPCKNGNAAKLLHTASYCAKKTGYLVQTVDLYTQNIAWCKGYMACKKTGVCEIQDDIVPIRDALLNCDLVILSSPTYFANVSAPVKNMFDRLVGATIDDSKIPKPKLSKNQKYLLLTTCNTPFPFDRIGRQSTGCLNSMKEFFHTSGMKCMGKVTFAGTGDRAQIPPKTIRKIENLFNLNRGSNGYV